jgi:predicted Zn-dependent peptidase
MKDRLIFESTQLDNGITVLAKPMDVPFAIAWLYIPVGHVHNTGSVLPGTAHFLEHIAYNRSRLYHKPNQFQKMVELKGGDFDASTGFLTTEYDLSARSDMFGEAFKGLMSHVFEPIITQEDITLEASIISSERKMSSKWYPGDDDL